MKKLALIKNGLWVTYGAIATRFLVLVSNLLLAKILQPSEYGIIGIAYIFWGLLNLFNQDTVGSFIVYKGIDDKRYLNTTYTIGLGLGICLAVGLLATSPLIAQFFGLPMLVGVLAVFAFNFLISTVQSVYAGILTRQAEYRKIANIGLICSLVRVASTLGSAKLGASYWSFVIGDTAYWLMVFVLTRRHITHKFQLEVDPEAKAEVLAYCKGAIGSGFGYYLNANSDNFTIGKLLGKINLGYYNFAYQLTMTLPVTLSYVFSQITLPAFSQMTEDKQQEQALAQAVTEVAFLAAPLYALFFLLVNGQTITLIFGEKWQPASIVIPWLLVFAYFRLLNNLLASMLSAKGRTDVNARVNLYVAPLAVGSFVFGAWQGGMLGVSIAVAVVLGIFWTVYWWWVGCRELHWGLGKFLRSCFVPIAIAIVSLLPTYLLPLLYKPLLFLSLYILCVRIIAAPQFLKYQARLIKLVKKLSDKRTKQS